MILKLDSIIFTQAFFGETFKEVLVKRPFAANLRRILQLIIVAHIFVFISGSSMGKGFGPEIFCRTYPQSPSCRGTWLACSYCHQYVPPVLNSFGSAIKTEYYKRDLAFTNDDETFKQVMESIGSLDSDGDGFSNSEEITNGTQPGFKAHIPTYNRCKSSKPAANSQYSLCQYDPDYAFKKIWNSVCGEPPLWEDFLTFKNLPVSDKPQALKDQLEKCLDYEYWLGKDGVVWKIGHYKIRPVGSVKEGEDKGLVDLVDYYDDYHIFVYSQIDGHDARDVLRANYAVSRKVTNGATVYTRLEPDRLKDGIVMQPEYRAGLLTSFWTLGFYLNYTAVARVLVAQAFNGFLGISLANMQGLGTIPREQSLYKDYDNKGVEKTACAECHETIDPMTYPFRNYNGLDGSTMILAGKNSPGLKDIKKLGDETNLTPLSYSLPRMEYLSSKYPAINQMPEEGWVLGQKVSNLKEWAEVVANSDQFASQTVKDYWKVLMGHEPLPQEQTEFERLWRNFKTIHQYSIEAMLAEMITTEAFGVP